MCVCTSSGSLQAYSGDRALGENKQKGLPHINICTIGEKKGEGQGSYR